MPRPTNEQMFEWANNPPEWQYLGYAQSQEELDELHDVAVEGRRDFLFKAAQHEIARRALAGAQTPETKASNVEAKFDFTVLPLRRTITLRDCETLAAIYQYQRVMSGERPMWDAGNAKRSWRDTANRYAYMNGFAEGIPKFSDKIFRPSNPQYRADGAELEEIAEESYERILSDTAYYSGYGFAVRFLMDGVLRVDEACLDVDSLELMLKKQRRRKPDNRYFGDRGQSFWEEMLRAKREFDRKGPHRDKHTYADIVDELAPGVYSAPYIDATVVRSRQFISIDDWHRAALGTSSDMDTARLVRGFNDATTIVAYGDRFGKRRNYYSEQDPLNSHGATFFDRALLPKVLQVLEHEKAGQYIVPLVEFLIREGEHTEANNIDPDYLRIVFGEQSVSGDVADVLAN